MCSTISPQQKTFTVPSEGLLRAAGSSTASHSRVHQIPHPSEPLRIVLSRNRQNSIWPTNAQPTDWVQFMSQYPRSRGRVSRVTDTGLKDPFASESSASQRNTSVICVV